MQSRELWRDCPPHHGAHVRAAPPLKGIAPPKGWRGRLQGSALERAEHAILPWMNRLVRSDESASSCHSRARLVWTHAGVARCPKPADEARTVRVRDDGPRQWAPALGASRIIVANIHTSAVRACVVGPRA